MYSKSQFTQALLSVYQEWTAFLAEAQGCFQFTYAGLLCQGVFINGKWDVMVFCENGYFQYTQDNKRELMRDFASYLCEKGF